MKGVANVIKKLSSRLNLIVTAAVLVLALLAFASINGSLAWLAHNEEVAANGMGVKISSGVDIEVKLRSFGVLNIEKDGGVDKNYTFNSKTEKFDLPKHDPNNISYDEYLKALVILFEITAEEATTITVSLQASGPASTDNDNHISNAVKFTRATLKDGSSDTADTPIVVKGSETFAFTTVTNGTVSKTATLDLIGEGELTVPVGTTNIYFIMEYNVEFVEYINLVLLADTAKSKEVTYTNDVKFIVGK